MGSERNDSAGPSPLDGVGEGTEKAHAAGSEQMRDHGVQWEGGLSPAERVTETKGCDSERLPWSGTQGRCDCVAEGGTH